MEKLEFKGTKGEWICEIKNSKYETLISCGKIRIAEAKHYNEGAKDWTKNDPNIEQGTANAKLIASAPSLLEALQYTLGQLKGLDGNNPTEKIIIEKCEKAIEKALK